MRLRLDRLELAHGFTISALYVNGSFECWVCEDRVREVPGKSVESWKVPGQTAIPVGTYSVVITPSARFKRDLPLLLAVPGFEGIRIHPGNTAADTEGCLLPGLDRMPAGVGRSRLAFDALFGKMRAALAQGDKLSIAVGIGDARGADM